MAWKGKLSRTRSKKVVIILLHSQVNLLDFEEKDYRRSSYPRKISNVMDKELLAKSLNVAKSAARALWSCSRNSQRCRVAVLKTGGVPFLAKLVSLEDEDILVPVTGLIQECCVEVRYMSFWYYISQYSVSPVNFIFCRSIFSIIFCPFHFYPSRKTCRL